jgi:anti-sigma factor ChrR (cupin superfamily)
VSEAERADKVVERLAIAGLFGKGTDFDKFDWRYFRDGIEMARLYGAADAGPSAALLRYAPGAKVPVHVHHDIEHILVLAGAQSDEDGTYEAGTLLIHGPGTTHSVASAHGCVALAIWLAPVEILESP